MAVIIELAANNAAIFGESELVVLEQRGQDRNPNLRSITGLELTTVPAISGVGIQRDRRETVQRVFDWPKHSNCRRVMPSRIEQPNAI